MAEGKIFVGRKAELEQFKEVLKNPKGQAVLVVGQAGMGKTWLVNKMAEIVENHPDLKCGWVRYEVTPTDSVDSTMALMMDNAFEAANTEPGSFDKVPERRKQWLALLKTIVPKGGEIAELVNSLRRDPAKNTREQFLERLRLISKRMPDNGRAIFIIDPEKYMQKDSDQSWAIVVKALPEKIKFLFAQRPEDVLVESETFGASDNISSIPEKRLDILDEESVDELINQRMKGLIYSVTEVREILSQYKGHPYALGAALDLLKAGTKLEELPRDPTGIAAAQWKELSKRGKEAIRFFKAYAILEVDVPNEVVESVSELDMDTLQSVLADNYVAGLFREEGEGKRIYHAILMDYIVEQIGEAERKEYHSRAVEVYRGKLAKAEEEQIKPDALAATRLAEHVLAAEGKEEFVETCAYETYGPLMMLGLLDVAFELSKRALDIVRKGSKEEAAVRCTMGLVYRTKGDLDEAEKMHLRALEIEKEGQREVGMAREYGNLGLIYQTKGDLAKAEDMHNKSLEIEKQLGQLEGMANQYGNLGVIYRRRGELDKAEKMHKKSLEISEKLGLQEGMASDYGNLGNVYLMRSDLTKAEKMYGRVLEIEEKLGRPDSIANAYGNLGLIYEQGGDISKAKEYLEKALELFKKIGIPHKVEMVEGRIEGIGKGKK